MQGVALAAPPVSLPVLRDQVTVWAHGGVAALLASVYPIAAHDVRMRAVMSLDATLAGAHFDEIRRRFALRREFGGHSVAWAGLAPDTVAELAALGFQCAGAVTP